jgi:multidrug efflux pump
MSGIVYAYALKPTGVEFFVQTEPEVAIVYVRARGNLSNEQKLGIVKTVYDGAEGSSGHRQHHHVCRHRKRGPGGLGSTQDVPADVIGQIQLELKPVGERDDWTTVQREFTEAASGVPGTIIEVREVAGGPQQGKDIRLQVQAADRDKALAAAARVRAYMEGEIEGLADIDDDAPLPGYEIALAVDREEAGRFGASVAAAGSLVQLITNGALIGTYRPDDSRDELDIRVRLPGRPALAGGTGHAETANPARPATAVQLRYARGEAAGQYAVPLQRQTIGVREGQCRAWLPVVFADPAA